MVTWHVAVVATFATTLMQSFASENSRDPTPGYVPFSCKIAEAGIANLSRPNYDFAFALSGVALRAGVTPNSPFAVVNELLPYGVGKGFRFSGPVVEFLDTISRHHGAEVKFEIMRDQSSAQARREYIDEHKGQFDILVGPFIDTAPRRKAGVAFSTMVADFSLSLYMMRREVKKPRFWDMAFYWLEPLDWSGYLTVLLVWIVPSFLMWRLEKDRQSGFVGYWNALWRGFLLIVGVKGCLPNWTPRRPVGRVVSMLWGFLTLIVFSTYTSSLTRFLLSEGTVGAEVQDITEFAARGYRLCVSQNFFNENFAQQVFRGKVLTLAKEDLPKAVFEGHCHGFLEREAVAQVMMVGGQPQTLPRNGDEPPYGCRMKAIGRRIMELRAGYIADRRHCKGHIIDVISSWVESAKWNATMTQLMQRCLNEVKHSPDGKLLCPAVGTEEGTNKKRVTWANLIGLVLVAFVPMLAVCCWETFHERFIDLEVVGDIGGASVKDCLPHTPTSAGVTEEREATLRQRITCSTPALVQESSVKEGQTFDALARRNAVLEEALTSHAAAFAKLLCSVEEVVGTNVAHKAKET
eukprot:TRINITY_DN6154_c0_g1_i1.p1 TRINITY_DN6154_c0_g1~~TRINITY_DN6154_c0_g1_i1.p1  ORF type:complete len:578 (-),score=85.55 TRINITY_DN6154_c0_g1_i1:72-1805(-)